ncbi:hypothetical protein F4677DRAFT_428015 [Hypoxylon crocopeplum]|nr:hypothetical protein F4677DRAFT_428015 [Hypoxylon crocopeplum]
MASDISRPSTEYGGSRPPTSRFVEGSMNDRVSAAPPTQFLEPDQLKYFEKQFHNEPFTSQRETHRLRRNRPFSEGNVLEQADAQEHIITHRKSMGFFGRVRDALGWNFSRNVGTQKQNAVRKHSSLQEPPQQSLLPPPPRPDHLRAAKSHSEMYNIPQLHSFTRGTNRPSRDDVMQSYNDLMATGFFQSHAIQSTRHAGPRSRGNDRRSAPLPSIPDSVSCSPQPPPRISSIDATTRPSSPRSPTTPVARARAGHPGRASLRATEPEEEFTHALSNKEPRYPTLRGRKRSRIDTEETNDEAPASTSSSFAEPLKRVAKKLRKMPSSTKELQVSDGVVHLPPSTSIGGTMYFEERAVRMRSPSPARPDVARRRAEQQQQQQQPPRRTFSNSSKEGNRLRKRGKSASLRSRLESGTGAGFETWEMAGERVSTDDDIHQDSTAMSDVDVVPGPARLRETTPLSVVPDANRGIPSVPRIPDRYHYYHKPRAHQHQGEGGDENENAEEAQWHFGEAL